jgi:hypothetical protein
VSMLNTKLRADLATMEINIVEGPQLVAGVVLNANQLDRVMVGLADIRSRMTPEVPHQMPHSNVRRMIRWSEPHISPDHKDLWMRLEMEGQNVDFSLPIAELGDTVQFLVTCAEAAVTESEETPEPPLTKTQSQEWAPIQMRGIGFAPGRTPEETLLVVKLAGFQLAFSVASSDLAGLADGLGQTARTLSAGHGQPQQAAAAPSRLDAGHHQPSLLLLSPRTLMIFCFEGNTAPHGGALVYGPIQAEAAGASLPLPARRQYARRRRWKERPRGCGNF